MTVSLPSNLPSISRAKLPAVYERAKEALTSCERIDECKDWADKAEALASYAKQANDDGLRKMADRIQARAIRRCGQLLEEIKPARGANQNIGIGDGTKVLTRRDAAKEARLSPRQQHTALRVARLDDGDFEQAVESDDPPTVTELAERGKLPGPKFNLHGRNPADFKAATSMMGWIRESAVVCSRTDPKRVVAGLLPNELKKKAETLERIEAIELWLKKLRGLLAKEK